MPSYPTNQSIPQMTFNGYPQNASPQPQSPFQGQWGQPQPQMHQPPVMSIAPVRGFDNMLQFPVAVGTDLYLIDWEAMKLYRKNNPTNPREYDELDLTRVIRNENQNEPVSRAELDEMKSMMAQMMSMIQTQQDAGAQYGNGQHQQQAEPQNNGQPRSNQNQRYNGKRGGRHDGSGNVPANDG